MDPGVPQQRGQLQGGVLRLVIVGHGPSVHSGLGGLIDTMTVVRLKRGLLDHHDDKDWGSRTDYLCARSLRFDCGRHPFWLLRDRYSQYPSHSKPTTGLCAVLEAIERLNPDQIYVTGFDRLMHPERPDPAHTWLAHDKWAEHEVLKSLGVRELG